MASPYCANAETLRSVAFGSITNSFAAISTALAYPSRLLALTNTSDADLLISIDGTNAAFIVPLGSAKIFDLCSNRQADDKNFVFPKGTQFYVKYVSAPSKGSIYLESIYGIEGI